MKNRDTLTQVSSSQTKRAQAEKASLVAFSELKTETYSSKRGESRINPPVGDTRERNLLLPGISRMPLSSCDAWRDIRQNQEKCQARS